MLLGDGPFNVVRVGGSGYSVLTRDARGVVAFEANERCSAGTGETVEGLCNRLGRDLDEAVRLAEASPDGLVVTSRCAVFAKSELTHYANEGEDHGRLFRGLFEGVARNVHALYDRAKVDGPVLLVGHGALIAPLARRFEELAGVPVTVPAEAGVFEALGALHDLAASDAVTGRVSRRAGGAARPAAAVWPDDPALLVRPSRHSVRALGPRRSAPARSSTSSARGVTSTPASRSSSASTSVPQAPRRLSSRWTESSPPTSTTGTDGNPVEAAKALVAEIRAMLPEPGGRRRLDRVGARRGGARRPRRLSRARIPRLMVENEIVAHATAAKQLDPDGGRSLSIVEIGGQDAKFINVQGGRILDRT